MEVAEEDRLDQRYADEIFGEDADGDADMDADGDTVTEGMSTEVYMDWMMS